jgi:threonylcarbamoyladenosine tRNA methylthiotransferase MtaB
MPALARPVIKERAERLRQAGDRALARHLDARIGRTASALVERTGRARAEDFTEIAFDGPDLPGQIVSLRITGQEGKRAVGAGADK